MKVFGVIFALLMKLLPPPGVFIVIHVVNIFCAALVFVLFYQVLRVFIPEKIALLWCIAASLDPIWSEKPGQSALSGCTECI
jgi:hypothetical protein